MDGLKCFQRQALEPVPGCDPNNLGKFSVDYCVEAKYVTVEHINTTQGAGVDSNEEHQAELEDESWASYADDEADSDNVTEDIPWGGVEEIQNVTTAPTLKPSGWDEETVAPSQVNTSPPTSANSEMLEAVLEAPSPQVVDQPTTDPTFQPETMAPTASNDTAEAEKENLSHTLSIVFDPVSLLTECQGDCNSHQDCAEGLFCFQRNSNEMPVPGCMGSAPSVADFCIDMKYMMINGNTEVAIEEDADAEAEMEFEEEAWEEETADAPSPTASPTRETILAAVGATPAGTSIPAETMAPTASASAEDTQRMTVGSTSVPSDSSDTASLEPSFESTIDLTLSTNATVVESGMAATFEPSEFATATESPSADASVASANDTIIESTLAATVDPSEFATDTESPTVNASVASTNDTIIDSAWAATVNPSEFATATESPSVNASAASTNDTIIESALAATVDPSLAATTTMSPSLDASGEGTPDSTGLLTDTPTSNSSVTLSPSSDSSFSVIENAEGSMTAEPSTTYSPTLEENATSFPSSNTETSAPTQMPYLRRVGNDGIFDTFPLEECEGDCDESEDCNGPGLACMQRIANETVPGCQGTADFAVDYCVKVEYLITDEIVDEIIPAELDFTS